MRGHEHLIEMRKAGVRPAAVFINDFPCKTDWADCGENATVCTDGDPLSSLDLRFVVGMTVHVSSMNEDRAKRLAEMCKQSGARAVAAAHGMRINEWKFETGWCEIWQATEKQEAANG